MKIDCPKEIKNNQARVGLTPNTPHTYVQNQHQVFIEKCRARIVRSSIT
jgi:alanine dehydrogenase